MNQTIAKLFLAVLSTLVTLTAVEIALRVARYGEWLPVIDVDNHVTQALTTGWMREDRTLLWRVDQRSPDLQGIRYVHRDNPNVLIHGSESKKRIIALGDSCTFFSAGKIPPYSLELERRFDSSEEVEVLNASVPGYSSTQGLAWLQSELLAYAPRIFIIYFGWNDHWRAHTVSDSLYMKHLQYSPLRILRLFKAVRPEKADKPNRADPDRPLRVSLKEYRANLLAMHDLIATAGSKSLFLTAPARESSRTRENLVKNNHMLDSDDYMKLHEQYNAVVRGLAKEGLRVLDLAALFEQQRDPASLFMEDGIHLSGKGIVYTADQLYEYIVTQRMLE